jgi:antitoxin HicB
MTYYCTIKKADGLYGVEFSDLPSVITTGETRVEALRMASEALNAALAADVARGFPLPTPHAGKGRGRYPVELSLQVLLSSQVRVLRGERTQGEVAAALGLSYQAYQRLENPVKANPSVRTLERVARAFGKKLEIRIA